MRNDLIPGIIAFSPALLLPLTQNVLRPRFPHSGPVGFALGFAPDLIVGFCFPFSILIRPRLWKRQTAARLFLIWSVFTAVALVLVELLSPFGPNVFDPADIIAGLMGVLLAVLVFFAVGRNALKFAED